MPRPYRGRAILFTFSGFIPSPGYSTGRIWAFHDLLYRESCLFCHQEAHIACCSAEPGTGISRQGSCFIERCRYSFMDPLSSGSTSLNFSRPYTCDGANTSPRIRISRSFRRICCGDGRQPLPAVLFAPSAPGSSGTSPPNDEIPAGIPAREVVSSPVPAVREEMISGTLGNSGPCPPRGATIAIPSRYTGSIGHAQPSHGATKAELIGAMRGHDTPVRGDSCTVFTMK